MNIIETKVFSIEHHRVWVQTKRAGNGVKVRRVLMDFFDRPRAVSKWETYFPSSNDARRAVHLHILNRADWSKVMWRRAAANVTRLLPGSSTYIIPLEEGTYGSIYIGSDWPAGTQQTTKDPD